MQRVLYHSEDVVSVEGKFGIISDLSSSTLQWNPSEGFSFECTTDDESEVMWGLIGSKEEVGKDLEKPCRNKQYSYWKISKVISIVKIKG